MFYNRTNKTACKTVGLSLSYCNVDFCNVMTTYDWLKYLSYLWRCHIRFIHAPHICINSIFVSAPRRCTNSSLVSVLSGFINSNLCLHHTLLSTVHSYLHEIAISAVHFWLYWIGVLTAELDWSHLPSKTRHWRKDKRKDRSDWRTMKKTLIAIGWP